MVHWYFKREVDTMGNNGTATKVLTACKQKNVLDNTIPLKYPVTEHSIILLRIK